MKLRIALAGNPNSGKTTLFNALTGSNQFVGNWPGVTVEKKEGKLKKDDGVIVTDLPGIYSLSPYTLEEVVARDYLINDRPDVILNIVDGSNLERNLYLTTQLIELGIPVVIAVNMMDIVRKNKDEINIKDLSIRLGCRIVEISALKNMGIEKAAQAAIDAANARKILPMHAFSGPVEHAIAHIEEAALHDLPEEDQRWYAIKIFERDDKVLDKLKLDAKILDHIEKDIRAVEDEMDDDAESIITNERYIYIEKIIRDTYKKRSVGKLSSSDKIDRIVTNRYAAFPIFALIMFLVYYISVSTVGTFATDWANEGVFGDGWHLFAIGSHEYEEALEKYEAKNPENIEDASSINNPSANDENQRQEAPDPAQYGIWIPGIPVLVQEGLDKANTPIWLNSLIIDGIIKGVGAVLGFVPQLLILFFLLAFLEACGYMSRIAFVLDRVFRRFGLSGKSFIPMLVASGCGVPGIMATRTIENERDRRMTIMTTTFIPCGAKLPIIAMIASALFAGSWWVAPSAYFIGIGAIVVSGIMLKKTSIFAGDPAPFVMELPAYHWPSLKNLLNSMWERGSSFVKKAATIILLASLFIWLTSTFSLAGGSLVFDADMELEESILGSFASAISWIFAPLGFGGIKATVATIMGLVAKEEVVGVFGVLDFEQMFKLAAYSFLVFNLLCAPCFAAIGAIKREMNSPRWTLIAIAYQTLFAYSVSLMIYQIGSALTGKINVIGLGVALLILGFILYMLFKPYEKDDGFTRPAHVPN
ncbi:MAG: ferrous iron transporter B [Tissierellia bacterium]|nr:ferrous iron transporter B [Tissierellia bacterium]